MKIRLVSVTRLMAIMLMMMTAISSVWADDVPSVWAENPITIDGKTTEWTSLLGKLLTEQNAALAVSNDQEFLYVTFRTTDIRWVTAIKMTGITLYLDSEGGKDKDFYIKYSGGPSREQLRTMVERIGSSEGQMSGQMRGGQMSGEDQPPYMLMFIKDQMAEKKIPLDGSQGPAAAFDTCQGFYTYEFRIPLAEGDAFRYGLGIDQGQKVGIGCVWGEVSGGMKRERPSSGKGNGGMCGGGMGGSRSGGMGGGGRGGERPGMPTKQEIWFKSILAQRVVPGDENK